MTSGSSNRWRNKQGIDSRDFCDASSTDRFATIPRDRNLNDLPQILVCPMGGADPKAVCSGEHAWQLGHQLSKRLREMLPHTCHTIHLFFAGPVALGYILGHSLRRITRFIQLYEYDFDKQRDVPRFIQVYEFLITLAIRRVTS